MTISIQNLPGSPVLHFLSIPGTACYRKLVLALSARRELLFMFGSRRSYQIWTYISDSETFCFLTLHKTSCIVLCMSTLLYFLNQAQLLPNCMYFLVEAEDKHQESIKLSNVVLESIMELITGCFNSKVPWSTFQVRLAESDQGCHAVKRFGRMAPWL